MAKAPNIQVGQLLNYVLQKHIADRAGTHWDLRFGPDKLLSWALPKGLPAQGQKHLAVPTPLHEGSWANFEGEILEGYGKGIVKKEDSGKILVTKVSPTKIQFVIAHKKFPEVFTMVKTKSPKGDWLIINTTPTEGIPHKKVHYTKVPQEEVQKLFDPNYLASLKIDGAACLHGDTLVMTDKGQIPIRDIVRDHKQVKVLSLDKSNNFVYKKVTGWWEYKVYEPMARLTYYRDNQEISLLATESHPIYTPDAHIHIASLKTEDKLIGPDHDHNYALYKLKNVEVNVENCFATDDEKYVYDLTVSETHNYVANGIVVSNSLYKLYADRAETLSYRMSTKGKPIIHTYRVGSYKGVSIPKKFVGTKLRGELYGVQLPKEPKQPISYNEWKQSLRTNLEQSKRKFWRLKQGDRARALQEYRKLGVGAEYDPYMVLKAIPPQELGGLLNSSTAKSLMEQAKRRIKIRAALFNVLEHQGKKIPMTAPYPERLALLKEVVQHLPPDIFTIPPTYTSPGEMERAWKAVQSGKMPLTREGMVFWPTKGGKPTKAKLREDTDVVIKKIFPGKGKNTGAAGGFWYSLPENPNKVVGKVGTGFSQRTRKWLWEHRNDPDIIGSVAKIRAQEQFPSGAYRAPRFLAPHDWPADIVNEKTASKDISLTSGMEDTFFKRLHSLYKPFLSGAYKNSPIAYTVHSKKYPYPIGLIALNKTKSGGNFLEIALIPEVTKKGYAKEVIQQFLKKHKLNRVDWTIHKANYPSLKLLKSLGGGFFENTVKNKKRIEAEGYFKTNGKLPDNMNKAIEQLERDSKAKFKKWQTSYGKRTNELRELNQYLKTFAK